MYREHFGLAESPFSIAPDPRYLYLSDAHREALAHLLYGVRGDGGFVLLTGEVGTGKTTICRCLLEQLPEGVQVALVLNPALTVPELLATVCDDLGVAYPEGNHSVKVFIDALNRFLLQSHSRGLTTVLIVDEAQNLSGEVLEQLRLLTNLETNSRKLLQIVLIGQPELRDMLERSELRQIAQRVTARYHLGPLDLPAARAYLQHRLAVAGSRKPLFSDGAVRRLHRCSRGIPRLLNVIADRSLLGSYSLGKNRVDASVVRKAAAEVLSGRRSVVGKPLLATAAALLVGVAIVALSPYREFSAPVASPGPPEQAESSAAPYIDEGEWVSVLAAAGDRRTAEKALLELWGGGAPSGTLCEEALQRQLACLNGTGSLALLERLDRPALLELHDFAGRTAHAVLLGLSGDLAEVAVGERLVRVPARILIRNWLGDFTLLWRPENSAVTTLGRGASGPAVAWLDGILPDAAEGDRGAAETFDGVLEARVKRFQVAHGLLPDGIAGPQTLILLNQRLGSPGPRLTSSGGEA